MGSIEIVFLLGQENPVRDNIGQGASFIIYLFYYSSDKISFHITYFDIFFPFCATTFFIAGQ